MTTKASRVGAATFGCVLLVASAAFVAHGCAGASKMRQGDTVDVSKYPKDIQVAYDTFALRCSRCHTLARPLNARIRDAQHWERYVARMRRNPSSGINEKDGEIILRFLLYYMHQKNDEERENEEELPAAPSEAPPTRDATDVNGGSGLSSESPARSEEVPSPRPVDVVPVHRDPSAPAAAPEGNP